MISLHTLIQRLNRSEKRFFRLYAQRNKKHSLYLQLFDDLTRGKATKSDSMTKRYLYELLLRALREYHHQYSIDVRLNNLFSEIEILYHKELLADCLVLINKAGKLALEYGKLTRLLDVVMWRRKLLLTQYQAHEINKELNELLDREKDLVDDLSNTHDYWRIIINIFDHNTNSDTDFLNHKLLKDRNQARTLRAKAIYYHILFSDHMMRNQTQEGLKFLDELIQLLEDNDKFIEDDPGLYLTTLNNKLALIIDNSKEFHAAMEHAIHWGEHYSRKGNMGASKQLLRSYNNYLIFLRETGAIQDALILHKQIQQYLTKHRKQIPGDYFLSFFYQFAYLHYCDSNYDQSLHWLNLLFKEFGGNYQQDLIAHGRFLNMMNHFQLRHYSILRYSVESCRRYLQKKRHIQPYEKLLLRFFSKISDTPENQFASLFHKLQQEIEPLLTENITRHLNIPAWINMNLH